MYNRKAYCLFCSELHVIQNKGWFGYVRRTHAHTSPCIIRVLLS